MPITVNGPLSKNIVAFARNYNKQWIITAVPRFLTLVTDTWRLPLGNTVWGEDTYIEMPFSGPHHWRDALTGEHHSAGPFFSVGELFRSFPGAMLVGDHV